MKKILFVTPGLGMGGTNPSLEALYNHIKDMYDVQVFAIAHQSRCRDYLFDKVLQPQNRALSMLYTNFKYQKGFNLAVAFLYKMANVLMRYLGIDLKQRVMSKVVKHLEKTSDFDTVVAYQEGYATEFVSFFQTPNKVAWIHCNYDKWLPKEKSEAAMYSKFRNIICVSNYTASVFTNRYPELKDRTIGLHNLVEEDQIIEKGIQTLDDARFSKDQFVILSAGRFHPVKRFCDIPSIAAVIKERGVDFCWYVIGGGHDINEMVQFEKNIQRFGVEDCVKWLGEKTNPYPYFKASDLYVCTSESEACPMVFVEAKLFGIPIVTTDFPSANEFLEDGKNGRIVPLEEVAKAVVELLTDKNQYNLIKEEIKHFSYNNEVLIKKVKDIL